MLPRVVCSSLIGRACPPLGASPGLPPAGHRAAPEVRYWGNSRQRWISAGVVYDVNDPFLTLCVSKREKGIVAELAGRQEGGIHGASL
jgi:hypothetical protein